MSVKEQREQGGSIGIVLHTAWFEPISNSPADIVAAERAQSFFMNWFVPFHSIEHADEHIYLHVE